MDQPTKETAEEARKRSSRQAEERAARNEDLKKKGKVLAEKAEKMVKKRNATPFWEKWGDPIGYAAIGLFIVALVVINYTGDRRKLADIPVNEDTFIQAHNEDKGHGYKLEKNEFFQGASLHTAREYLNNNLAFKKTFTKCDVSGLGEVVPPESYNFYTEHPLCRFEESFKKCASGHVEIPLSVLKNRVCMKNPEAKFDYSVDFLLNCNTKNNKGCKGGYVMSTLAFMKKQLISSQCYNETIGENAKDLCPVEKLKACESRPIESYCSFEGVNNIKREIKQNGPIFSVMHAYRDFLVFSKGNYVVEDRSKIEGLIIVKVVGWETDKDLREYWLVETGWGKDWGEAGIAKVKIGSEESTIEKYAFTLYDGKQEGGARAKAEPYLEDD